MLICFTCLCLLYVYQQTEIFCLAYDGQKRQAALEDLLEKNTILRYNIGKHTSLVQLGNTISRYADFQMPDTYRFVRLTTARNTLRAKGQLPHKQSLFSRIFGIKRQAEAKTINP